MSTPVHIQDGDLFGRVHTVYTPLGVALFDFIVDRDYHTTICGRGLKVTKTKKQLKDFPLGEQYGN